MKRVLKLVVLSLVISVFPLIPNPESSVMNIENNHSIPNQFQVEVWNPDWGTLPFASIIILSKTDLLLNAQVVVTGVMEEGYSYTIRNMRVEIRQITYSGGWVTDKIVKQETFYDLQPDTLGQVQVTLALTPQDNPPLGEVNAEYYVGVSGKINVFADNNPNPISIEPLTQVFTDHFFLEAHDPHWGSTLTINILSSTTALLQVLADVDYTNVDQEYRVTQPVDRIHLLVEKETSNGWKIVGGLALGLPSEGPSNHYLHVINLPDSFWQFPPPELGVRYKITATALIKVTLESFTIVETEETIIESEPPKLPALISNLKEKILSTTNDVWRSPAENRKESILSKIDQFLTLYDEEFLSEAYDKLLHDIKPKMTGRKADENGEQYGNGIFKNPWVFSPENQDEFALLINEILQFLQEENSRIEP
ncbi:MAG: hypothetical protein ACXAB2_15940 [Candidatus Hodarchaeales archaeon]